MCVEVGSRCRLKFCTSFELTLSIVIDLYLYKLLFSTHFNTIIDIWFQINFTILNLQNYNLTTIPFHQLLMEISWAEISFSILHSYERNLWKLKFTSSCKLLHLVFLKHSIKYSAQFYWINFSQLPVPQIPY